MKKFLNFGALFLAVSFLNAGFSKEEYEHKKQELTPSLRDFVSDLNTWTPEQMDGIIISKGPKGEIDLGFQQSKLGAKWNMYAHGQINLGDYIAGQCATNLSQSIPALVALIEYHKEQKADYSAEYPSLSSANKGNRN